MKDGVSQRSWVWFTGVVAGHLALLAFVPMGMSHPRPRIEPPTVIGMLVPAPPLPAVTPPKPLPAAPAKPRPAPRPLPRPDFAPQPPAPNPPSERAVSAPPPETGAPSRQESTAASSTVAATSPVPAAPAAPAPVIPPRTDAAHLNNPAPLYPAISRRFGEQGRVLFDVYILADGRVGEIRLKRSSGYSQLDQAALDAVRRWRYVPARRGDEPIPYWYVQPITFSLDS